MEYEKMSNEDLEELVGQKDAEAICVLAERYLYGRQGQSKNMTRAYQLLHKGEKMGLSRAYVGLGEMYRNGWRFAKNESLAREYYAKAGVAYPDGDAFRDTKSENPKPEEKQGYQNEMRFDSIQQMVQMLDHSEQLRQSGDYAGAKAGCNQVMRALQDKTLYTNISQDDTIEVMARTYWQLAFIAFNEQNFSELERYAAFDNVKALYPWSVYLVTVAHRITNQAAAILQNDLKSLLEIYDNCNLSLPEYEAVNVMIGDLLQDGYGSSEGMTADMADMYYQEASRCRNA